MKVFVQTLLFDDEGLNPQQLFSVVIDPSKSIWNCQIDKSAPDLIYREALRLTRKAVTESLKLRREEEKIINGVTH